MATGMCVCLTEYDGREAAAAESRGPVTVLNEDHSNTLMSDDERSQE